MDNMKLKTTDHFSAVAKSEPTSTHSTDAFRHEQINIQMVQSVLLICLDNNIDNNSANYCNTITQLQRVVDTIYTFTDGDQFIQFLDNLQNNKVCMIMSDLLGQHIVPRVHDMFQVDSILIFCDNKYDKRWTKDWFKIKGMFTEIPPIGKALKQVVERCEQNAMPISFIVTTDDISKKNLDQLDPSFMYTQILKEILLIIKFEQEHIAEFIQYCRSTFADKEDVLKNIQQFEQTYCNETAIWWYTQDSFFYPMVNHSLRLMSVDIIIKMGFFIADLHRHIEQLHNEQFTGGIFTVYRGQGMTKNDLEKMTKTKGGLLSFNCFLSTSKDRAVSLCFAESNVSNPDLIGVLFVMTIDSTKSTTPFASVINVSYFHNEDEVLFSMHTVFRICDIKPMDENQRLFQVDLILTSDDDKDLRLLTNQIREETKGSTGWDQLGGLLLRMGQAEKAQQVYEILLKQTTEESAKVHIYNQLGAVKYDLGEYNEVIIFHEKSIVVQQQSLPLDHLDFAKSYNSIGMAYRNMGDYSKALSYYEKAFEISQKALPFHHPDLARSYNNIGMVYRNMGEYLKALSFHEKGLEILQKSYPPNHPGLAKSYNYIGLVHCNMREYSEALSYFEKAFEIWQQSLPPNHPDLAKSRNNIGSVYYGMGEYFKALSFHEKAVEIWQKSFLLDHPRLAYSYDRIGMVYDKMSEYSRALSSHEKALSLRQQSLPPNHPHLARSYNNIGSVYYNMAEYSNARSFYERAVNIGQQSLPTNHPELLKWKKILDDIKNCN